MTTQKRLQTLEALFLQRAHAHVNALTQRFTARYGKQELLAVATFLDSTQRAAVDPALAATGAGLLADWRSEMTPGQWRAFWLLDGLAATVDSTINSLLSSPTEQKRT